MKHIIELTGANFESEVLKATGPVVVDFYAPWCGPCKMLAPVMENLAVAFAGKLKFAKLNIDDVLGLASSYGLTGVPTLILFRQGKPVDQVVGFPSPQALVTWLENAAHEPALAS